MMNCRDCAELLMEFLSGDLTVEKCDNFRAHLEGCRHCHIYVETYQATIRLTRQLPCGELPPDVAQRLQDVLRSLDQ
jgi:anti-sigma factor RsiW